MYIRLVIDAKRFRRRIPGQSATAAPTVFNVNMNMTDDGMTGVPLKQSARKHDGWTDQTVRPPIFGYLFNSICLVWKYFCLSSELLYFMKFFKKPKERKKSRLRGAVLCRCIYLSGCFFFFCAAWKRNVILVLVINYALGQPKPITTIDDRPPAMCAPVILRFAHELCVWDRRGDRCLTASILHTILQLF